VVGYHLINLLIHLIYACFVYLLAKLILSIAIFDNLPQRKHVALIAFFIALICVTHPIQTQAVAYIVQRMTSLASMFYIMCLFFYGTGRVWYIKDRLNSKVFLFYLLAFLSGILALFSKQIAITIPFSILLFELFFIRNKDGVVFKKYLIIASSMLFIIFLMVLFGGLLPKETDTITRSEYLFTQFRVVLKYLQLLLVPVNQVLDYDFSLSERLFEWKVIVSSFLIISLLAIAFFVYKKKHLVSFGIFWFFITLSVESSIIPIKDVIFEHRLYLPMFGFSLVFVSLIWDFLNKKSFYTAIVFLLTINITYGVATHERNKAWESRVSIWTDNTIKKPNNERAHNNLGSAYIAILNLQKAEKSCEEAVRLKPDYNEALVNLGFLKIDLEKPREAIKVFDQLIKVDSVSFQAYYGRGIAYTSLHENEKALNNFSKAISCKNIKDAEEVYNKSGLIRLSTGKFEDAISDFDAAIIANPDHAESYNNRGAVNMELQEYDAAINDFY